VAEIKSRPGFSMNGQSSPLLSPYLVRFLAAAFRHLPRGQHRSALLVACRAAARNVNVSLTVTATRNVNNLLTDWHAPCRVTHERPHGRWFCPMSTQHSGTTEGSIGNEARGNENPVPILEEAQGWPTCTEANGDRAGRHQDASCR